MSRTTSTVRTTATLSNSLLARATAFTLSAVVCGSLLTGLGQIADHQAQDAQQSAERAMSTLLASAAQPRG